MGRKANIKKKNTIKIDALTFNVNIGGANIPALNDLLGKDEVYVY